MNDNTQEKSDEPYDLDTALNKAMIELQKRVCQTNWFKYILRHIPLYSSVGLFFYLFCFLMSLIENIGLFYIHLFLKQLPFSNLETIGFSVLLGLFSISVIALIIEGVVYYSLNNGINYYHMPTCYNFFINICLITILSTSFFMVLNSEYPLLLGLSLFSTVTITSLLVDKTLGYTKSNERYRLFFSRAKYMLNFINLKKQSAESFDKEQYDSVEKFYHDLWNSKHDNTVSDTSYLLKTLESIKSTITRK